MKRNYINLAGKIILILSFLLVERVYGDFSSYEDRVKIENYQLKIISDKKVNISGRIIEYKWGDNIVKKPTEMYLKHYKLCQFWKKLESYEWADDFLILVRFDSSGYFNFNLTYNSDPYYGEQYFTRPVDVPNKFVDFKRYDGRRLAVLFSYKDLDERWNTTDEFEVGSIRPPVYRAYVDEENIKNYVDTQFVYVGLSFEEEESRAPVIVDKVHIAVENAPSYNSINMFFPFGNTSENNILYQETYDFIEKQIDDSYYPSVYGNNTDYIYFHAKKGRTYTIEVRDSRFYFYSEILKINSNQSNDIRKTIILTERGKKVRVKQIDEKKK